MSQNWTSQDPNLNGPIILLQPHFFSRMSYCTDHVGTMFRASFTILRQLMFTLLNVYLWVILRWCQWLGNMGCIYRVSQEECARLREGVPYVKIYRYNPNTYMSKVERLRR
jgi:hypothetical protein